MKQLERKLLVEQKSLKLQLREQQKNAKEVEAQLGEALVHLEEFEKFNDLSVNPVGKFTKTPKPKPRKESEKKEGNKSNLDCSKPGTHYSKIEGTSISKPILSSSRVVNAPSSNAGYMQQKQHPQQQQRKPSQQCAPQKQRVPIQSKAKELQPENMAGEKNPTATSDSDSIGFKGDDLDYTDTRGRKKSDEESVEKETKGKVYISDLEYLYGDEDDIDANQIENYWEKHFITTRKVSKDDGLCDVYKKFCKSSEIGDTIIKPICGLGTTGRKL